MPSGWLRRSRLTRLLSLFVAVTVAVAPIHVTWAAPHGGIIAAGSATVDTSSPGSTVITQQTARAIVNWQGFSTAAGESVRFAQPSASAVILNRVTGHSACVLNGSLTANGRVFLLNRNGILFGPKSQVSVGSLVASSLDMKDDDFMAGRHNLAASTGHPLAAVVNQGSIRAANGGAVALVGPVVSNQGTIEAPAGRVALAAGTRAVVNLDGAQLVNLAIPVGAAESVTALADGVSDALKAAVNDDHVVEAGSVQEVNGKITLGGAEGLAMNEGTIRADGAGGAAAGTIRVEGAQAAVATRGSRMSADGQGHASSGGDVRLLSAGSARLESGAALSARGGETGNGGFLEVSGTRAVMVAGTFDTSASHGAPGTTLIDPGDLTIVDQSLTPGCNEISETVVEGMTGIVQFDVSGAITLGDLVTDGELLLQPDARLVLRSGTGGAGDISFTNLSNTMRAPGTGGGLNLQGGTDTGFANINVGHMVSEGFVSLHSGPAGGNIAFASVTARHTSMDSQRGSVTGGNITVTGLAVEAIDIRAGTQGTSGGITLGTLTAQSGPVLLRGGSGGGDISTGAITANDTVSIESGEGANITLGNLAAGAGALTILAGPPPLAGQARGGNIVLDSITADSVFIQLGNRGGSLTANRIAAGAGAASSDDSGFGNREPPSVVLALGLAPGDPSDPTGTINLGSLSAAGSISVAAGVGRRGGQAGTGGVGLVSMGEVRSGNGVFMGTNAFGGSFGGFSIGSITTGNEIVFDSHAGSLGDITLGRIAAGTSVLIGSFPGGSGAGNVTVDSIVAAASLTVDDARDVTVRAITARDIQLRAQGDTNIGAVITQGSVIIGGIEEIGNPGASLSVGSITVGSVIAHDTVQIGRIRRSNAAVVGPSSVGDITVGSIIAQGAGSFVLIGLLTPAFADGFSAARFGKIAAGSITSEASVSSSGVQKSRGVTAITFSRPIAIGTLDERVLRADVSYGDMVLGSLTASSLVQPTPDGVDLAGGVLTGVIGVGSLGGNVRVGELSAGSIDIRATRGSILDANGDLPNLKVAPRDARTGEVVSGVRSTLRADGIIGTAADPIDADINPGELAVSAGGAEGGVSVAIKGCIEPSESLVVLNSPPGAVLLVSTCVAPTPTPPATPVPTAVPTPTPPPSVVPTPTPTAQPPPPVVVPPPMPGAREQLASLLALLGGFGLPTGIARSLSAKLENAQAQLERGDPGAALNLLEVFKSEVRAQTGKSIPSAQADALIAAADEIISAIEQPESI